MGAISDRLKDLIQETRNQKIIRIETLYAAREKTMQDLKNVMAPGEMGPGIDPAHAVYASAQNFFSVLAENLSRLALFDEYVRKIEKSMDTYEPGYPPMSPVTNTFFSFWAHFDLRFGIDKETMGSCILDVADVLGLEDDIVELFTRFESFRRLLRYHHHTVCHYRYERG